MTSDLSRLTANAVAQRLQVRLPDSWFNLCQLTNGVPESFACLSKEGASASELAVTMSNILSRILERSQSDHLCGEVPCQETGIEDRTIYWAMLCHADKRYGIIAILSDGVPKSSEIYTELSTLAACVSASLYYANVDRKSGTSVNYLPSLAKPLAHECNNFLNVVGLQIALLERELNDRERFAELRRQANSLKAFVHKFQAYHYSNENGEHAYDCNKIISQVAGQLVYVPPRFPETTITFLGVQENGEGAVQLQVCLDPLSPKIRTASSDFEQLIAVLLLGAAESLGFGRMLLSVTSNPEQVRIQLDEFVDGPYAGDSQANPWGDNSIEWLTLVTLVRKLDGKIEQFKDTVEKRSTKITFALAE